MSGHSPIGASGMDRWSVCPGSIRLSRGIPATTSSYAEEGTKAHQYFEDVMHGKVGISDIDDEEMRDAVQTAYEIAKAFISIAGPNGKWGVETGFDLSAVYPGCWGTNDFWWYNPDTKTLGIMDFKYGAGKFVSADTKQIKYYALGAAVCLNLPEIRRIELGICQPRAGGEAYRSIEMDLIDLLDFKTDLVEAVKATERPDAPLVPGDHCQFCPAKGICPTLHANAQLAAQKTFSPQTPYNVDDLAKALASREVVKAWLKGIEEFAYAEMQRGVVIAGYKLVNKKSNRSWKEVKTETGETVYPVYAHLKAAGFSDEVIYAPKELKSPAQMEKALGKQKGLIKEFTEQIPSGTTIAEESDPRPAVNRDITAVFAPVTPEQNPFG